MTDLARTCLVTGAGRGIGRAIAVRLAEAGHRVALTARNAAELDETAALCKSPTLVVPADLTEPAAAPSKLYPRMDIYNAKLLVPPLDDQSWVAFTLSSAILDHCEAALRPDLLDQSLPRGRWTSENMASPMRSRPRPDPLASLPPGRSHHSRPRRTVDRLGYRRRRYYREGVGTDGCA